MRRKETFLLEVKKGGGLICVVVGIWFFYWYSGGWSPVGSTRHCGHQWPIVPAPGDYDDREIGGMIGRGNRRTAARMRTRAAAVGSQRLIAWATARPGVGIGCLLYDVRQIHWKTILRETSPPTSSLKYLFIIIEYFYAELAMKGTVVCDVTPYSLIEIDRRVALFAICSSLLAMEVTHSSETSVHCYKSTRRHILESIIQNIHVLSFRSSV
jgi:hypothetical protein